MAKRVSSAAAGDASVSLAEIAALGGTTDNVQALIVPLITDYGKIEVNVAIRERT